MPARPRCSTSPPTPNASEARADGRGLGSGSGGAGEAKDLEEVVAEHELEMASMRQQLVDLQRRLRHATKAGDVVRASHLVAIVTP